MPIYEYRCSNEQCNHNFELLQKISEPDPGTCPECGQASLRRALNAPRFQLKGKGWYMSDFRESDKPLDGVTLAKPDTADKPGNTGAAAGQSAKSGDKAADKAASVNGSSASSAKSGDSAGGSTSSSGPSATPAKPAGGAKPAKSQDSSRPSA